MIAVNARPQTSRRTLLAMSATALLTAFSFGPARAVDANLLAAAKAEGQLVAYGDPTQLPVLIAGFSKKYPEIRVTSATLGGWQAYYCHLNEKKAGKTIADIIYTGEDAMLTASGDGELQAYRPTAAPQMAEWAADPKLQHVLVHGVLCGFLYNDDSMKGIPIPKDWTDLVTPKKEWNGLFITADPRNSSMAYAIIAAVYQNFGPEKGGAILKGLKEMNAELSPNAGPQTAKLMSGERPFTPTFHTGYLAQMLKQGAPIKLLAPTSGMIAQYTGMGITKDAPHPNAAKLFVEYSLSPEAQADLTRSGAYSMRKDVGPPAGMPPFFETKLMPFDLPKALKDRKEIIAWWQASLGIN